MRYTSISTTAPTTTGTTAVALPVVTTATPTVTAAGADPPTTWGGIHQIVLVMLAAC